MAVVSYAQRESLCVRQGRQVDVDIDVDVSLLSDGAQMDVPGWQKRAEERIRALYEEKARHRKIWRRALCKNEEYHDELYQEVSSVIKDHLKTPNSVEPLLRDLADAHAPSEEECAAMEATSGLNLLFLERHQASDTVRFVPPKSSEDTIVVKTPL
ncbi:hypothetical protein CYMTET_11171, partial [Cymbomonas tetramitiformis]